MKRVLVLSLAFLLSPLAVPIPLVGAAVPDVTIRFRPHCSASQAPQNEVGPAPRTQPLRAGAGEVGCQEFPLYDPETLITSGLKAGGTLDIDIVLLNPSRQALQSTQSWIEYDPTVLKGMEAKIADQFPLIAPGEQTFSEGSGLVKLGASNVSGGVQEPEVVFARVTFQVLSEKEEPVLLRFHEFNLLGQEGRTKALLIEEGRTVNVLKSRPKDLLLYFGEGAPPTTLPPSPVVPTPSPQSITPLPIPLIPRGPEGAGESPLPDDGFLRLQPQNLRIMTEEDRVYVRWDLLHDQRVAGYNVYYGTVSGRYIQRRTVARETAGVTIRGLPVGKRYYFAVAAFDARARETQFSYEGAVIMGDPGSSTAPFPLTAPAFSEEEEEDLSASLMRRRRGRVPGESGMPVAVLSFLIGGAVAGSVLTLRLRQRTRS